MIRGGNPSVLEGRREGSFEAYDGGRCLACPFPQIIESYYHAVDLQVALSGTPVKTQQTLVFPRKARITEFRDTRPNQPKRIAWNLSTQLCRPRHEPNAYVEGDQIIQAAMRRPGTGARS